MAGGYPHYSYFNRFTMYTPYVAVKIQQNLEAKAIFDPKSSTGYSTWDPFAAKMKEFTHTANGEKVPTHFRVPVTTIVGYYETDPTRDLPSYVFPALHGAYGFVYGDEGNNNAGLCKLVVDTNNAGQLVYALTTSSLQSDRMNKFHVNILTDDEPYKAAVYCDGVKLAERALDPPDSSKPELKYTLHGAPFGESVTTPAPATPPPTNPPTPAPIKPPTDAPNCDDVADFIVKKKGVEKTFTCAVYLKKKNKREKMCKNNKGKFEGKKISISKLCPSICDLKCNCKNWHTNKLIIPSLSVNKKKWCKSKFKATVCKDGNEEYCPKTCGICYDTTWN